MSSNFKIDFLPSRGFAFFSFQHPLPGHRLEHQPGPTPQPPRPRERALPEGAGHRRQHLRHEHLHAQQPRQGLEQDPGGLSLARRGRPQRQDQQEGSREHEVRLRGYE